MPNNILFCDYCENIVSLHSEPTRLKEECLCDNCYRKTLNKSKFFDEQQELLEIIRGEDDL